MKNIQLKLETVPPMFLHGYDNGSYFADEATRWY